MSGELKVNGCLYISITLLRWRDIRNEAIVRLHDECGCSWVEIESLRLWQFIQGNRLRQDIMIRAGTKAIRVKLSTSLRHALLAMYPQILLILDWPYTQPLICDRPFGRGLTASSIAQSYRRKRPQFKRYLNAK